MILTGEMQSTGGKTYHSVTLSPINPTRNILGLNPGLRGDGPATGTATLVSR
jgi:hypothetical protein